MELRFEFIGLNDVDAERLLARDDWVGIAQALSVKGDLERAMTFAAYKMRHMERV